MNIASSIATPQAMRALGFALGKALSTHQGAALLLAITGELGAGKTTLVSGILSAFGHLGPARSPTYTLIEPYQFGSRLIHHLDLYRIATPMEVEGLGFRDLLTDDSILLVEWPERGAGMLPPADVSIDIVYADGTDSRAVDLRADSQAGMRVLSRTKSAIS